MDAEIQMNLFFSKREAVFCATNESFPLPYNL